MKKTKSKTTRSDKDLKQRLAERKLIIKETFEARAARITGHPTNKVTRVTDEAPPLLPRENFYRSAKEMGLYADVEVHRNDRMRDLRNFGF